MRLLVRDDAPTPIRRRPGSNVTLVNQSAVDVYIDSDYNRIMASATGAIPAGTQIINGGGQAVWSGYLQDGVIWVRSATPTTVEVIP